MSGISGYPTSKKLDNNSQDKIKREFVTVQPAGSNKFAANVIAIGFTQLATGEIAEVGSTDKLLVKTAHTFKEGDLIRLQTTANSIEELEVGVLKIIDANTVELTAILSANLSAGDTYNHYRPVSQRYSSTGSAIAGPTQFKLDGLEVEVNEDTVTPANNKPLPVKLMDTSGDLTITANNLNVQLEHNGANPDSVQVGDGTNKLGVTASNEAKTFDATAHGKLDLIGKEATLGTRASEATAAAILAKIIAAPATELKQDTIITALSNLLAELQAKADVTETQPVSAATLPLPTGAATAANQATGNTSLTTIASNTTSIDGKLPTNLGQKEVGSSISVCLATSQEHMIDGVEAAVVSVDGKTPALGQTTLAGSVPVAPASDYEMPLAAMDIIDLSSFIDLSTTNIPGSASAPLQLIASSSGIIKKVQTIDTVGAFIGLYIGAAASEVLYCYLPVAGGEVDVDIPAGTRISIRNMDTATLEIGNFAANFIG